MELKPILSLDFDGVIHSYVSKWINPHTIPDPPVPGALQFMRDATEVFRVCIYSTRSETRQGRTAMGDWLSKWVAIETDPPYEWLNLIEFPESKPPAFVGIDDRVITFKGSWPAISELRNFTPWNKPRKTT